MDVEDIKKRLNDSINYSFDFFPIVTLLIVQSKVRSSASTSRTTSVVSFAQETTLNDLMFLVLTSFLKLLIASVEILTTDKKDGSTLINIWIPALLKTTECRNNELESKQSAASSTY